ncbi:MAG TPA: RHS repeat-associated core domain-containing protein [Acidisarcina sp.]
MNYEQYVYNALGVRVAKASIAGAGFPAAGAVFAAPGAASGFSLTNQYLLDQIGDQVTELNGSGTWTHSNVCAGAHLQATYDTNGLHFQLAHPLGTRRIETAAAGTVDGTYQSLPFGDNLVTSGYDATEHHFTGKEHDAETGNEYFEARYYGAAIGRWMSPDWSAKIEPVPYSKLEDPQSLNLYAYARNNPLTIIDADGHDAAQDSNVLSDYVWGSGVGKRRTCKCLKRLICRKA